MNRNTELYQTADLSDTRPTLEKFREVSKKDVATIMSSMKRTSCAADPYPTTLLKQHWNILTPLMTRLVNLTFVTGHFPIQWKIAIVTPLIKKSDLI